MEIDVQNIATDRRMLHLLDEGEPVGVASDLELHEDVLAGSVAQNGVNIAAGDLQRLGFVFRAVDDSGHSAGGFDFANGGTSERGAAFGGEFYLFSHGRVLLGDAVDLKQRRNGFVIMNPLDAFAEKLGDAKHSGLKSFHRAHRRAVGRN